MAMPPVMPTGSSAPMRPIFGFSSCAARSRIHDAFAPLLVATSGVPAAQPREGAPGSPNLSAGPQES
jgi:hypothetical protein